MATVAVSRRVFSRTRDSFRLAIRWSGHTSSRTRKWFASWRSSANCPPHQHHRDATLRLAIALLYTTGLRLGELVRLTVGTTIHVSTLYSFASRSVTSHGSCRSRPTVFAKSISILTPVAPDRSLSRRRVRCFGTTLGVEPPIPAQDVMRAPRQLRNSGSLGGGLPPLPWHPGPAANVRILRFKNLPPFRHDPGLQNHV
jgi:hypothetical protein